MNEKNTAREGRKRGQKEDSIEQSGNWEKKELSFSFSITNVKVGAIFSARGQ